MPDEVKQPNQETEVKAETPPEQEKPSELEVLKASDTERKAELAELRAKLESRDSLEAAMAGMVESQKKPESEGPDADELEAMSRKAFLDLTVGRAREIVNARAEKDARAVRDNIANSVGMVKFQAEHPDYELYRRTIMGIAQEHPELDNILGLPEMFKMAKEDHAKSQGQTKEEKQEEAHALSSERPSASVGGSTAAREPEPKSEDARVMTEIEAYMHKQDKRITGG